MKENNKLNHLLTALGQHKPLILDLGDNVLLYPVWNEEKQMYQDEMGWTTMKLLLEIAEGKVEGVSLNVANFDE